jgi:preprotein translocase subunit SecA
MYLKTFALKKLPKWIKSAIKAKYEFKINHHYLIIDGNIVPIDYENTGVLQKGTHYSNGLHQFLQIKEQLMISDENLMTNYLSNVGYFNRFIKRDKSDKILSNNIYGLSGTLGTEREIKLYIRVIV